jgi:hypothetical protein
VRSRSVKQGLRPKPDQPLISRSPQAARSAVCQ